MYWKSEEKKSKFGGRGEPKYKSLIPPAYSMYIHYWYRLMSPSSVVSPVPLVTNQPIKGTVARDFWPPVFSTNRPHIVPKFTPWNIFEFCFKFAEIFVFKCYVLCGVWYPAGLYSAWSDTPQKFVKWGIRPRRMLFCGVSDLAEQMSAIKSTQLCHCSAGSDTPQDWVPFSLKGHFPAYINYTTQGI